MVAWRGEASENSTWELGASDLQASSGTHNYLWLATARVMLTNPADLANVGDEATRTSTNCFMRGLKERIGITTSSGHSWIWRRICFTFKGEYLLDIQGAPADAAKYFELTTSGMVRGVPLFNTGDSFQNTMLGVLQGIVFKGARNEDWSSEVNATVSRTNVTVKYDVTRVIKSGNDSSTTKLFKIWHPMNANLTYNDDELGGRNLTSYFSTGGLQGMGDYYVYDIFEPAPGGTSTDVLRFDPHATLYWHER